MDLIKEIIIKDPPTKYIKKVTKRREGSKKKNLEDVYYLTANLFYSSDIHFSIRSKIVNGMKDFLFEYLDDIPKLSKMKMNIIYQRPSDGFDLDNKIYFWQKILLDLFKEPSDGDVKRALKYKKEIKSLRVIKDDSCKYVNELNSKYEKGPHLIKIQIFGILLDEQQKLF